MRTAFLSIFFFFFLLSIFSPATASLPLPMNDAELDDVRGQSGIAVAISDLKVYLFDDGLSIEDTTDLNRIELRDAKLFIHLETNIPFTLRIYQNQWNYSMIALEAIRYPGIDLPALEMDIDAHVNDFSFFDADTSTAISLGSLHVTGFSPSEFGLYAAPLATMQHQAVSGIGFQLEARLNIEEFRWIYNEDGEQLGFTDLYLANSFLAGDDYTDPDTWIPDGRFAIGRIDPRDDDLGFDSTRPAPATFHVVEDPLDAYNRSFLRVQLPMEGSLRIAETELGGKNFGPVIIDGFHAHHFQVDMVPW